MQRPDGLNLHAVLGPGGDGGIILAADTDVVAVEMFIRGVLDRLTEHQNEL